MNTHAGYSKKKLDDTLVLLAGGGDKSLADFLGGIQYVSASHKILIKTAANNASWTDLVTLVTTDENVKQIPKTDNANRPLMMINGGTSTGTLTSTSLFSTGIYANASTNTIIANGFVKADSSSSYVLLGDGSDKALSDFSMSDHTHIWISGYNFYNTSPGWSTSYGPIEIFETIGIPRGGVPKIFAAFTTDSGYKNSLFWSGYGEWGLTELRSSYISGNARLLYRVSTSNSVSLWGNFHTIANLDDIPTKASWNYDDRYVTFVGVTDDNTNHKDLLRYVINGVSNYFTVPFATNATLLNYTSGVTTLSALDNDRHQANVLKCYTWNGSNASDSFGTSYPGASNGIILDGGWSSTSYGFQLAIDDDPNWFMALRQRNGNGWAAWKRIPMGDGTGASGTWAISISGNAATATKLETARTINGVSFDGSANIAIAPSLLISGNTIASQVGDLTSSYITVPYATSASRLKYKPYSNNLNDPGTLLAGGGITRNYGSGLYWQNCPSGLSYGACVEFYAGDESLSGQFIWDINHNQTTSTRNLYFRASNNLGWLNDWKRIAWASEIPTVNNASLTLQTDGTTQTTFYANDSTNRTFNVTCANIGAATSGHNHDGRYMFAGLQLNLDFNIPDGGATSAVYYAHGNWTQSHKPATYGLITDFNIGAGHLQLWGSKNNDIKARSYWWTGASDFAGYPDWVTIWHSGNDGADSGLDADLLDGYHASAFAATSHTHPFSQITDGTSSSINSSWSHILSNTYGGSLKSILYMCHGGGYGMHLRGYSTSASVYMLQIYNSNSEIFGVYGDGHSVFGGNVTGTNFYTTSDRNKKTNISSFSEHIRKFQLKDTEKWHYGVIAQEVEEMFRDGEEGNMTVNYNSILSFYIGSLENSVAGLEDAKRLLENKVRILEERIKRLESK